MPKPLKKAKPRRDANQAAFDVVRKLSGEDNTETPPPSQDEISRVMSALGRKGGQIGGKRRLETMTQAERSAVALKAARARWKKAKRR
jgi:hypothetical protein